MNKKKLGISDMGLYVPKLRLSLSKLIEERSQNHPEIGAMLYKASQKTGQKSFHFPEPWEDTASLAANAAATILDRLPSSDKPCLRYLTVGTETAVDHAKPVSSYVQGMLEKADYPIGRKLSTFDVKHACAGGSIAMLSTAALLNTSGRAQDSALTIAADIARYEAPSTAEITHGAGAIALLLERNPRLIALNLENQGYFSSDKDDFFRPLDSATAKVKGGYSMKCYQESLEMAFLDYCTRKGKTAPEIFASTDYMILHVPFPHMPETALRKLLKNKCFLTESHIDNFMEKSGFMDALHLNASLGNLYTGSIYIYLMALLHQEWGKNGEDIVGRSILFASYGSGNTMLVFSGIIAPEAPEVITSWDLGDIQSSYQNARFEDYKNWLSSPTDRESWCKNLEKSQPRNRQFYLKNFDQNGLRIYDRG